MYVVVGDFARMLVQYILETPWGIARGFTIVDPYGDKHLEVVDSKGWK